VEQRTDFEKLVMEVSTDGTIHPEEAVKQGSRILIQHLMIITDENITFDNRKRRKRTGRRADAAAPQDPEDSPGDLDLSVRAFNCLKAARSQSQ